MHIVSFVYETELLKVTILTNNTTMKSKTFFIAGILIVSISQILTHYFQFNDFTKGMLAGVGLGLLLLALLQKNNTAKS